MLSAFISAQFIDVLPTDVADAWVPPVVLVEGVAKIGRIGDPVAAKAFHALVEVAAFLLRLFSFDARPSVLTQRSDAGCPALVAADPWDRNFKLFPAVTLSTAQEAFVVEVVVRFLVPKAFLDHSGQDISDRVHDDHRPFRKSSSSS